METSVPQTREAMIQVIIDRLSRHPAAGQYTALNGEVTLCEFCTQRTLSMYVEHTADCPITLARRLRDWKA